MCEILGVVATVAPDAGTGGANSVAPGVTGLTHASDFPGGVPTGAAA